MMLNELDNLVERIAKIAEGEQWKWIQNFTNLLLQDSFKR